MNLSGTLSSDYMKLAEIPVNKRPSLINFAATDFVSLRDSLIQYAKAVYPLEYQYFVESDLGLMFLEMIAYMGSVMSLKADMLANENFLSTANQRSSVKKLLELIGVRMRGPLSAAADVEVSLSQTPGGGTWTISQENRVITVTSPEDGGQVSYTLYQVENGLVTDLDTNANADLEITTNGRLYTDLAIQEGALVTDSGDFAATEGVRTIQLTTAPVIEGSVQVFIDSSEATVNGAFHEVDNLYFASGISDKIFEIVYDDDFGATVVFGDGTTGISPDDSASYLVTYRIGGGSRGNLLKESINTAIEINAGVGITATLTNVTPAVGGANAESIQNAKKYAPLTFRRQDRLVTLQDYSVFANTFISNWGTVGKARAATRRAYASANTIDIYVLEKASDLQLQKATPNFKTNLLEAISSKKMATDEVVIVDGLIRTIDLVTTIKIDEEQKPHQNEIISKVREKILNYMGADNRSFGQALEVSDINRKIFEVDAVRYSTLNNLDQDVLVDFNEIIQLNNLTINVELLS